MSAFTHFDTDGVPYSKHRQNTNLLVGLLALLHTSLVQCEVILEEVGQQMPEHAGLEQVGLQPEVHAEGTHTLRHHCAQSSQVLEKAESRH